MAMELKVPAVGESITEVFIGQWRKAVGDVVQEGDVLVEIESDKATVELPAPQAGTVTQILKQEGDEAVVGETIAIFEPMDGAAAADASTAEATTPTPAAPATTADASTASAAPASQAAPEAATAAPVSEAPSASAPATAPVQSGAPASDAPAAPTAPTVIMPAAQKLLEQFDIDPALVPATGPGGRLLVEDVQRYIKSALAAATTGATVPDAAPSTPASPSSAAPSRTERAVRMTPIRRRIAERLVEAQHTAALLTTFNEIDMTRVMELRKQHRDAFEKKHGARLGFMSFFVKASVAALKEVPEVNAEIRDNEIVYRDYYDIGIAVGGGRGLVVPVLRNAETMDFAAIELAIADFAKRAQENRLSVDELQGGTFTISNGGVYGSLLSTPIVNPPQSGILGLHRIQERPVVVDGEIVVRPMMYVALTYDHRIIDGREAVTFLRHIKELMEEPERMLFEI